MQDDLITLLKQQLEEKDRQIAQLLERTHEQNVIIRSQYNQLLL